MRTLQLLCCIAIAIVFASVSTSRGDGDGEGDEPVDDTTEPITGEPVIPNPGSEQPMRDPFAPHDIGGSAAAWRLEDLTAEERIVALRGQDDDQLEVQDAYAQAARELATRARAESAAITLGIHQLGEIGVVP